MNSARMLFVLGFAVLCVTGCSDSANTAKPKEPDKPLAEFHEPKPDLLSLKQQAEAGDAAAQFELGQLYYEGGLSINFDRFSDAEITALKNEKWDQVSPDNLKYFRASEVRKDAAQAVAWWRKAAEQGHAGAQFGLGLMYANGEGVPKDAVHAVGWYRKAAEQGNMGAQYNLGLAYARGAGVPKEDSQATTWNRKAADQGHAEAQVLLGLACATGRGVPRDYTLAYMWYNLAAAQGNEAAITLRDATSKFLMTPVQIAEAQRLTREWKPGQHTESPSSTGSTSGGAMEKNSDWYRLRRQHPGASSDQSPRRWQLSAGSLSR